MELLTKCEIAIIAKKCGCTNIQDVNWTIEDYSSVLIGYLGEHLKLTIKVKANGIVSELYLFLKCLPRFDKWKADYIRERMFFRKEHAMLSGLFKKFQTNNGERKWRPRTVYIKDELFIFEDVTKLGYVMPHHIYTLAEEELMATVKTLARFHAQSYIYEELKTKELNRPYRIIEDYGEYLTEPIKDQPWRETGKQAIIDYLKEYSAYKSKSGFDKDVEMLINLLFERALNLMKPSTTYRNVVIHRDIWANNIFFKKLNNGTLHALIVDYQTVLFCSPMLDLSSFLFYNTTKNDRYLHTNKILQSYYAILNEELNLNGFDVHFMLDKDKLTTAYDDSIVFGITQAALIVPIIAMNGERKKEIYSDRENVHKLNCISRSAEFIETARTDINYRKRVNELLDEIVERFIYPTSIDKF